VGRWAPNPLIWGLADHCKHAPPIHMLLYQIWLLYSPNRMGVGIGSQKFWGRWSPPLKIGGMSDPLETRGTTANLVVLGQTVGA